MGVATHHHTRYAAFISYAHADEAMAARLHKALETYPVPKHLRKQGKTTKPVFRDVAELTAAHSLSEKIRDAVRGSRVLIVLCSPAAKASHWVNEEIRLFRELHGDAAILSAIIDGTPDTAFPQALTEDGREPLAAALGKDKAGFRLGVTQLAAGMLGTGLDDLVQRGAKRRQRILGAGLAASLALSGVMGFTALQAVEARNEAELERAESEALLDYMVKDLKVKLEPVGRLELLEGVGRKAIEYYDKKDIDDLSDDNLRLLAAARQVIAQVALDAGRMEEAQSEIEASAALTEAVFERNPDDTDAIFAHAQSEYWVADYNRRRGKLAEMEKPLREYDRLAQILYKKDPTNFDWVMEAGWGKNNLGTWAQALSTQELAPMASKSYSQAIHYFEEAIAFKPNSKTAKTELVNAMSGKANVLLSFETAEKAREYKLDFIEFQKSLLIKYPGDINFKSQLHLSQTHYYNGFYLSLNKSAKEFLAESLNQLFNLAQYDRENLTYKNYFLTSVSNAYESYSYSELVLRKSQIKEVLEELPKENTLNVSYYKSMIRVFDVKINVLRGYNQKAKENLKILNNEYFNKTNYSSEDWRVIYYIFLQNQENNDKENTIKFAKLFLEQIKLRSDLNYPTVVFQQFKTWIALQNCDRVIPLAKDLLARGYLESSDLELNSCNAL